jgi:hypothetical protein
MINYISLGNDCSPAATLRNLNLRKYALPFDWVVSNINSLKKCFETNFENYHKNLQFNSTKTRLIDHYGFAFIHDYPLNDTIVINESIIGEGVIAEEKGRFIIENWSDYYSIVLDKYNRRIERFKNIINDTKPIIVLCRYTTNDEVLELQQIFINFYKKNNIYFLNSSREIFENDKIKNIYTERNNEWNELSIWQQGIDDIIQKINSTKTCI